MFKANYEVTNSVNDDEVKMVKYFAEEDDAKSFIKDAEDDVDEWNKPEPGISPYAGGKMSTRYIDTELIEVTDDTVLDGLTMGNLIEIIMATKVVPTVIYDDGTRM